MFTLDTSVIISAVQPAEASSADSRNFLRFIQERQISLFSPTLLMVEVAAVLSRSFNIAEEATAISVGLRYLPNQSWISLDPDLAYEAAQIAAQVRLRGADAVYAAVAHRFQTTLVTLDRQQLERLPPLLPVRRPGEILAALAP
jgi:predicted nucleic acid-binding protein